VENRDLLSMGSGTLRANKMRSALSMLGIAIGVGSVVLLTSIGEGTRVYIAAREQDAIRPLDARDRDRGRVGRAADFDR